MIEENMSGIRTESPASFLGPVGADSWEDWLATEDTESERTELAAEVMIEATGATVLAAILVGIAAKKKYQKDKTAMRD